MELRERVRTQSEMIEREMPKELWRYLFEGVGKEFKTPGGPWTPGPERWHKLLMAFEAVLLHEVSE